MGVFLAYQMTFDRTTPLSRTLRSLFSPTGEYYPIEVQSGYGDKKGGMNPTLYFREAD
jgi:hypothetical protein